MTKAAFTPGPWTMEPGHSVIVVKSPATEIGRIGSVAYWQGFTAEDNANARLIAAAPKMYAALARVVAANASFRATMPRDWDGDPLQDACAEAAAALAEAEAR